MTLLRKVPAFNISILNPGDALVKMVMRVKALDTYDGATKNFHPDGLFSTSIFGIQGSRQRKRKFGYIDLKIKVIHPVIFDAVVGMREFYGKIIAGSEYAVWNPTTGEFDKSTALEGGTGYSFFMKHWKDLKFNETGSQGRSTSIELFEKFKNIALIDKLLVMPAAFRDIELDDSGRETSDEVNKIYGKTIAITNNIVPEMLTLDEAIYDQQRWQLQRAFNELFDYIFKIWKGKHGLYLSKWMSRAVNDITRNVITAMPVNMPTLDHDNSPGLNHTCMGIYQTMKAVRPIAIHHIRTGFVEEVFTSSQHQAKLVNKETLKSEMVDITGKIYDAWATSEGILKNINRFKQISIRHNPITIGENHYLGLLYDDGVSFKLIHGIDELPEDRDPKNCRPVSWAEFYYICMYKHTNRHPVMATRYPVAGLGSIYPSLIFLESTVTYEHRNELGEDWQPIATAHRFPIPQQAFYDSMSPHASRLAGAAADFDGDMMSANVLWTEEAIEETNALMDKRVFYVNPTTGELNIVIDDDTINYVVHNLVNAQALVD